MKESEKKSLEAYYRTQYVEFLEFIALISVIFFRNSELAEETLTWKIEYILDQLFRRILETEVKKNQIIIEEFSDSDDDY